MSHFTRDWFTSLRDRTRHASASFLRLCQPSDFHRTVCIVFSFPYVLSRSSVRSGIRFIHASRSLSYSIRRCLDMSRNDKSDSTPINLRPIRLAAIPVVELPANGSSTRALIFELASKARTTNANGFCVGCFPHVFSHLPIAGKRQTSVICRLPAIRCMRS